MTVHKMPARCRLCEWLALTLGCPSVVLAPVPEVKVLGDVIERHAEVKQQIEDTGEAITRANVKLQEVRTDLIIQETALAALARQIRDR